MVDEAIPAAKPHHKRKAGKKLSKKETKKRKADGESSNPDAKRNPRAFVYASKGKSQRQRMRTAEREQKRMHAPMLDKSAEEPPPYVILVQGPPGVGKSLLIRCLIKHFSKQVVTDIRGPITVVSGKTRRLTFVECPQDLNSMIDAAKYADLVLLLIDGSFGFEMETFEFLNLLQVHGFPKVMGVLTHLDGFKDAKALKVAKKTLKHRFWSEIYQGAKLFYLNGLKNGRYLNREILNLARFISVMKFRPLTWRLSHPYLLVDRLEELTPVDDVRRNPKCNRSVALYGYVRGANWRLQQKVHIAGLGDVTLGDTEPLPDPCPSPSVIKKRTLNEKERLLYAPMSDVGVLSFDKDGMYIDIPDWKVQYTQGGDPIGGPTGGPGDRSEGEAMVLELQGTRVGVDEKLQAAEIQLFADGPVLQGDAALPPPPSTDSQDRRTRRPVAFDSTPPAANGQTDSEEDSEGSEDAEELNEGPSTSEGSSAGGSDDDGGGREAEEVSDVGNDDRVGHVGGKTLRRSGGHALGSGPAAQPGRGSSGDGGEGSDEEGLGSAARWKHGLLDHAAHMLSSFGRSLQQIVYEDEAEPEDEPRQTNGGVGAASSSDDDEDFFKPKGASATHRHSGSGAQVDSLDSSVMAFEGDHLHRWFTREHRQDLRNRFVTGDWDEARKRSAARPAADGDAEGSEGAASDSEGDVYGDFEDVEGGVKYHGKAAQEGGDGVTAAAMQAIEAAEAEEEAEKLRGKKLAKKAAFDQQYDTGEPGVGAEEEGLAGPSQGPPQGPGQEESYYDAVKREMAERAAETRAALDQLEPTARTALEGLRAGTYVRLVFHDVPCELVQHFDPRTPILVGGLLPGEDRMAVTQLRIKRHRWFPKILKNRDPLVFSIGWRRFQSIPVFSIEDRNGRNRMLKYSPEHMHCTATVFGPVAPPNTGVVAVQNLGDQQAGWRVAATGVVTNLDASARIMKKLKLVGTPLKIHKHTAFVKGMFTSQLEAAKFEGASVRTVSGIRGSVKRALRAGTQGCPDGTVRVTMEDKPVLSDILFLRAWVQVDVPKLYNPVTNLLVPPGTAVRSTRTLQRTGSKKQASNAAETVAQPVSEQSPEEVLQGPANGPPSGPAFVAAPQFLGARPGYVFKAGLSGLGYYADGHLDAQLLAPAAGPSAGPSGAGSPGSGAVQVGGWVSMKTVAQLRRERGEGAPRNSNSLYRPIVRPPPQFNALKVPKNLQQRLPYKSKPKLMLPRARKTLEQRRAVVLEPDEKKKVTLLQQLATIQNKKLAARKEQHQRQAADRAKKLAAEEAWRKQYNREERSKRYREQALQQQQQQSQKRHKR